jgi:hypothetical protein
MKSGTPTVVDGRRAFLRVLFAACFTGVATFWIIPIGAIAFIAAIGVGISTGFVAGSSTSTLRAVLWCGTIWGVVSVLVQIVLLLCGKFGRPTTHVHLTNIAFLATVVSLAGLCGGLSHLLGRAIPLRDGTTPPFQFSISEIILLTFLFAACLSFGIWFEILASPEITRWLLQKPITK